MEEPVDLSCVYKINRCTSYNLLERTQVVVGYLKPKSRRYIKGLGSKFKIINSFDEDISMSCT